MALSDPRSLFIAKLGEAMYVEQRLTEIIPTLAGQAQDPELRQNLEHHLEETQGQLTNLQRIAEQMGGAEPVPCAALDGLVQDHEQLMGQEPPPDLIDLVITGSALKNEHLEIASYEVLIAGAQQLGESRAVELLQQNLQQEQHTAREIHQLTRRLTAAA